jgi:hypothetical protein
MKLILLKGKADHLFFINMKTSVMWSEFMFMALNPLKEIKQLR